MRFSDGVTGVMVTSGATLATTDGGEAWSRRLLPDGFHPSALAITPPGG